MARLSRRSGGPARRDREEHGPNDFDPLGVVAKPLEDAEVVGCEGQIVRLDGPKAALLRLHNETRVEHGLVSSAFSRT